MMHLFTDLLVAFQFLTRIPLSRVKYAPDALSRSAKFFPLVGVGIGVLAWLVHLFLSNHLSPTIVAIAVVLSTVLITGSLHEDGLADAADAFGGGWNREQTLAILKDSRIGSYGALALIFSCGVRVCLLREVPDYYFAAVVICAHTLCRWTALPLSYFMSSARDDIGQGARIAGTVTLRTVILGTALALAVIIYLSHLQFWIPLLASVITTVSTGLYYRHRLNGITGDCLGATNQLTEIVIYLCGIWHHA